jgi:hypothetical protein
MQAKSKWYIKAYHTFFLYLPVLFICSLIALVYLTYVFSYITILLESSNQGKGTNPSQKGIGALLENLQNYAFFHTSRSEHARTKGIILLSAVTFSLGMLLISLLRTVFMDPGYFPTPMEMEYKIILKNISGIKRKNEVIIDSTGQSIQEDEDDLFLKEKCKFINNFPNIVQERPMTFSEGMDLREEFSKYICNDNSQKIDIKNDLIIEQFDRIDKNGILELSSIPKDPLSDPYEKFKSVDFNKLIFCGTCLRIKHERSHHCRACGRCVLKMDHHCPWLSNCIGFRNYKYFLLIHFYGLIGTTIIAFSYWEVLINDNLNFSANFTKICFSIFIYITNLGLFSFLLWLFIVNWGLVFNNLSVIEQADRERFPSSKAINIYDMGCYKNFTSVFGTNPLVWFMPFFANYKGEGVIFETNEEKIKNNLTSSNNI